MQINSFFEAFSTTSFFKKTLSKYFFNTEIQKTFLDNFQNYSLACQFPGEKDQNLSLNAVCNNVNKVGLRKTEVKNLLLSLLILSPRNDMKFAIPVSEVNRIFLC